jgi:hypothetical protein
MTITNFSLALTLAIAFTSCSFIRNSVSIKEKEREISSVNNNVCKRLRGDVLVYAIFVDSKPTLQWTDFDITTTLDSIQHAVKWLEAKAYENGVPLNFNVTFHQKENIAPIEAILPKKTLNATLKMALSTPNGYKKIDKWADQIAKVASQSLPKETPKMTKPITSVTEREQLVSKLRDIYKTENVALVYFVNNYYKEETSFAIHTSSKTNLEYIVMSYKNPAVIAHELLHLFGAADLYMSHYDHNRRLQKKKRLIMREFPDEIMAFSYRRIETLNISPITCYLIGWDFQLDPRYNKILFNKGNTAARY